MVGPLFYYDLMRVTRRGRGILLRCCYTLALLGALFCHYYIRFPNHDLLADPFAPPALVPPSRMAVLAAGFVLYILLIQTVAVFLLTPAYLAGAVAEERERGTLELLFTTHLSAREIVLGKLLARLTHLVGVVLAGLPLLMLTQLWGGVENRLLVAAFYATALNLLSVGAICILCSVCSRTVTRAVLSSYVLTALVFALTLFAAEWGRATNPAGLFEMLANPAVLGKPKGMRFGPGLWLKTDYLRNCLLVCTAFNGLIAVLAATAAVLVLRPAAGIHRFGIRRRTSRTLPAASTAAGGLAGKPVVAASGPPGNLPPIGRWPLLWKETHRGRKGMFARYAPASLAIGVLLITCYVFDYWTIATIEVALESVSTRGLVLVLSVAWCLVVAFRTAAGVSRERDNGTLEGLLTLPVSRAEILGAKWLGPIVRSRALGFLLAAALGFGLLTGSLHPVGAALLAAAVTAHIAFLASLGVLLSVASRTTLWARVTMALVLLAVLGIGLRALYADVRANDLLVALGHGATRSWSNVPWAVCARESALNMPGAWWFLTFTPAEYDKALLDGNVRFVGELAVVEGGIVAYALIARLLFASAGMRLRRELGR
jgi:ABC-type transport system involved in multi-copper enzyme maturation permease subunit